MSLGFGIIGSGGIPVGSTANGELSVATNTDINIVGFEAIGCERDSGLVTGTRNIKAADISDDYRIRAGTDTIWFNEVFAGSAIDSAKWQAGPLTTMTTSITGGFFTLNAGLSVAASGVARLISYRSFPIFVTFPVSIEMKVQFAQPPVANNVSEWGFFISSALATPTDGVFFRLNAAGEFRCIINNNGAELQSNTIDSTTWVGTNVTHHYTIEISNDNALFWIDDTLVATLAFTGAGSNTIASMTCPVSFRTYNTAAGTASAQVMKIANASVNLEDSQTTRPWPLAMAGNGQMGYQGQVGGTMGSTASIANSAAPTLFTGSNTATATGQAGLGGLFNFVATAAATTDFIISSYQVPVGTAALPGKSLYITGIKISSMNQGTAVATTPTSIAWQTCFGHFSSASLAATENAATPSKAPRRVALGIQTWPVGAAIGAMPANSDTFMPFSSPILVQPGEYVQTVARFVNGTATASQTIYAAITFDCFWE